MVYSIALIMIAGLCRRKAYAVSSCRPTFIPTLPRRQQNVFRDALTTTPTTSSKPILCYYHHTDTSSHICRYERRSSLLQLSPSSLISRISSNSRIPSHKLSCLQSSSSLTTDTQSTVKFTTCNNNKNTEEPFTWSQLIDLFRHSSNNSQEDDHYISSSNPNLALFRRSTKAQCEYEKHKKYIECDWESAYDYLVMDKFGTKFGFEKVLCEETAKYRACPSLTQASKYTIDNQMTYLRLVLNDYPYDVEEGIEHWCLWKIGGKSHTEGILKKELTWAANELGSLNADKSSGSSCIIDKDGVSTFYELDSSETTPSSVSDMLYWVNPPHLQSMPEIHHAHMLVVRVDQIKCRDEEDTSLKPPL